MTANLLFCIQAILSTKTHKYTNAHIFYFGIGTRGMRCDDFVINHFPRVLVSDGVLLISRFEFRKFSRFFLRNSAMSSRDNFRVNIEMTHFVLIR